MTWICGECSKICEQIKVDEGGYEEYWGGQVWHAQYSDVSDCCNDDCYTLKDWISNGWPIPTDHETREYFHDEGLLDL